MKKLTILDLSKDYNFQIENTYIYQLSFGLPKLKNTKNIKNEFFSEQKFSKFRSDINRLLYQLFNKINKNKNDNDFCFLEIFNSRNDKIRMYDKIFYLNEILSFIKKKKIKNVKIISDDKTFYSTYKYIKLKDLELNLIGNENSYELFNFYFYLKKTTLFFLKTFVFLSILKFFSKKNNVTKNEEVNLSMFPHYFKNGKNSFYNNKFINLNFLISDETHLNNSLSQNISSIFKLKDKKNLILTEQYISFGDVIFNFLNSLKRLKYLREINNQKIKLKKLDLSNQFRSLFLTSLLNYNKLKNYEKAIKQITSEFKFKKLNYYLFEYNFGYFIANLFRKYSPLTKLVGYQHGIYSERLMWQDFSKMISYNNFFPDEIICKYKCSLNEYKKNFINSKVLKKFSKKNSTVIKKKFFGKFFNVYLGLHDCNLMINELRINNCNNTFFLYYHPKLKKRIELNLKNNFKSNLNKKKKSNFMKLLSPSSTISYQLENIEKFYIINPKNMIPLNPKKFDKYKFILND